MKMVANRIGMTFDAAVGRPHGLDALVDRELQAHVGTSKSFSFSETTGLVDNTIDHCALLGRNR